MVLENGTRAWSCCNNSDEHCHGCIDDHSVNVRHTLANVKRQFHNYIDYPIHPLVSTSSVVLRGHNAMLVEHQMNSAQSRLNSSGGHRRPLSAMSTFSASSPTPNKLRASTSMLMMSSVEGGPSVHAKLTENSLLHASVSQSLDAMNQSSMLHSAKEHFQSTANVTAHTSHSRPHSAVASSRPTPSHSRPTSAVGHNSRRQSSAGSGIAAARQKNSSSPNSQHHHNHHHAGHQHGGVSYEPVDLSKLPAQRGSWKIPLHTSKLKKFLPLKETPPVLDVPDEEPVEESPRLEHLTASPHSHHTYDTLLPSHASGGVLPHPASEPEVHAPRWVPTHTLAVDHVKDFNESLFSAALPHVSGGLHSGGSYVNAGRPKSGLIGRVRVEANREFSRKNRPMASPDGFALYMK